MKKIIALSFLLVILIVSCKQPAPDAAKANNTDRNSAKNKAIYEGIISGDMSTMDSFVAADAIDHGNMGDIRGRDSIKKMLSDMHNHFTNLKMEIISEGTSSSGDYHFTLVRMTGKTKDDKLGLGANSNIDMISVDVVKLKDGMITEHWEYQDPKTMFKMMGFDNEKADSLKSNKKTDSTKNK